MLILRGHPLIFLDIDGVLNRCSTDGRRPAVLVLPEIADRFERMLRRVPAKVVVSSSWRRLIHEGDMTLRGFGAMLGTHGMPVTRGRIIGATCPQGGRLSRGDQIRHWLDQRSAHAIAGPVVAIDDHDRGITRAGVPLVRVNGQQGLTDQDVVLALELMGGTRGRLSLSSRPQPESSLPDG